MSVSIRYAARSHLGLVRPVNEDSLYAGPRLLAIADGMGGHVGGDVASRIVIHAIAPLDEDAPPRDLLGTLREAAESANNALRSAIEAEPKLEGMGTTLTAMLFDGTRIGMVHIGDSRAYLRTGEETSQISHDDTLVQQLVDEGKLTAEQAAVHPHRSAILYALMGNEDITPHVSIRQPQIGDRYLLCSDGVSDYIPDMIPGQPLTGPAAAAMELPDPDEAADRLIELALEGGGRDNISCIVADIVEEGRGTEEPVIDGAAAEPDDVEPQNTGAAMRTAEATPKRERFARKRRRILFGFGFVVVLLAVLGGFFAWLQSQYFVKAMDGKVAVYRGVNASVAGLHLYEQVRVSDLQVEDLVGTARKSVHDGLAADDRSDADAIVANLGNHELLPLCPQPAPTPSTRPSSRPKNQNNQNNQNGRNNNGNNNDGNNNRQRTNTPTPTPSPTPTPVRGEDCR